ncbi:MAG: tetratricopeptide repeat-containing sensor histidine kinase [Bacteroidetes bacterium]|nr:tetratricopeptide repeat-containing sensor histidine kinase [Bacteroidota bacterium]MBS1540997.1 tetratricopeptide repeat-containing sensor histidine kinase [Bacteroidota bacterium]
MMDQIAAKPTEAELSSQLTDSYNLRTSDLKKSIQLTQQLLQQCVESGYPHLEALAKNHLGLFFLIQGEFGLSQQYSQSALEYFETAHHLPGIADSKYNIGSIYYRTNKYHEALLLLAECLKIYREGNDYYNLARTLKSMGTIYEFFNDQDKAIESYEKSIEACQMINELGLESNALNPLSAIYFNQGKQELAMDTIERSIRLKNETHDIRGLAYAMYGRAKLYIKQNQYTQAITDLLEAVIIQEQASDRLGLCMAYNKLGMAYYESGELDEAKKYFNKTLELSKAYHIEFMIFKAYHNLYLLAKKENHSGLALEHLEKHLQHKESVINKENYTLIKSYEAVTRIETLERETSAQKEKNKIIESKNAELDSFFYRVSHDLKGPIASLQGLDSLVRIDVKEEAALKYFDMYRSQVSRIHDIVIGLIHLTQLNHLEVKKTKIDFEKLIDECIDSYQYFENFKDIRFIKKIEVFNFYSEWAILNTILQNLIENGIKYATEKNPFLEIAIYRNENQINIIVSDNGQGIDEQHQAKIFDMFYRANKQAKGSGLGLYILKRAVERLNGHIKLVSEIGKGSTFTVTLPQ